MFNNDFFTHKEFFTMYRALKAYECMLVYGTKPYADRRTKIEDIYNIVSIQYKFDKFMGCDFNNYLDEFEEKNTK